MKKNMFTILLLITIGMMSMLLLQGCDKEETLTADEFAPPTNLKALSKDGSVILSWSASTASGGSSFAGYHVITKISSAQIDSQFTTQTKDTVVSLTNGQEYTFYVRSVNDDGDVSEWVSINWGPSQRFVAARIYEFDAVGNPSGLEFSNNSPQSFSSSAPDNRGIIDLWIDGRDSAVCLLKSPHDHSISSGWRQTKLLETSVSSLDAQVDIPPASSSAYRLTPGLPIVASKVYIAINEGGHFVRFQVTAAGVQGTAPNRFIDIVLAYNSGTGAWAK